MTIRRIPDWTSNSDGADWATDIDDSVGWLAGQLLGRVHTLAGTANAITAQLSMDTDFTALSNHAICFIVPTSTTTGAVTLAIEGGSAIAIKDVSGNALTATQVMISGRLYMLVYNASEAYWRVNSSYQVNRAYVQKTSYSSYTSIIAADDTIPQISEGTEVLTLSISPSSNTARLRVTVVMHTQSLIEVVMAVFSNSASNAIVAGVFNSNTVPAPLCVIQYEWVPGTSSSIDIDCRLGPASSGTVYVNGDSGSRLLGGVMKSTMVVEEVAS